MYCNGSHWHSLHCSTNKALAFKIKPKHAYCSVHSTEVSICKVKRANYYNINIWRQQPQQQQQMMSKKWKWWRSRKMNEWTKCVHLHLFIHSVVWRHHCRVRRTHSFCHKKSLFLRFIPRFLFLFTSIFTNLYTFWIWFSSLRHFQSPYWNSQPESVIFLLLFVYNVK